MSNFLNPLLYLLALGVGLGHLVDHGHRAVDLGGVSYLQFVAPALVAVTAMQTAAIEATYPVVAGRKWLRTYFAALATPVGTGDLVAGHLLWMALRVTASCGLYLVVVAAFGALHSPLAILAVPVAVLTGMAFAGPLAAFSVLVEWDGILAVVFRFGIVPLFLFSGAFFPLSQLPVGLRIVADCTPLEHGVSLCRALALGRLHPSCFGDLAYLIAVTALGVAAARRSYARKLRQ